MLSSKWMLIAYGLFERMILQKGVTCLKKGQKSVVEVSLWQFLQDWVGAIISLANWNLKGFEVDEKIQNCCMAYDNTWGSYGTWWSFLHDTSFHLGN